LDLADHGTASHDPQSLTYIGPNGAASAGIFESARNVASLPCKAADFAGAPFSFAPELHSMRNARTGSMDAARRAGTRPAIKAQNANATIAAPVISGLNAATP